MTAKPKAIVLLSGGMDSCVTTAIAARECRLAALHVSYGQLTEARERRAFEQIADFYQITERLHVDQSYIGAVEADSSGYPDCRPEYYQVYNQLIAAGTRPETRIEIVTPLITLRKQEIVKKGIELDAPFHLSWSCYRSQEMACGRCDSCALRLRAFEQAGAKDAIPYAAQPSYHPHAAS